MKSTESSMFFKQYAKVTNFLVYTWYSKIVTRRARNLNFLYETENPVFYNLVCQDA